MESAYSCFYRVTNIKSDSELSQSRPEMSVFQDHHNNIEFGQGFKVSKTAFEIFISFSKLKLLEKNCVLKKGHFAAPHFQFKIT